MLIIFNCCRLNAQLYVAGEFSAIKTQQVIIENYTSVKLVKEFREAMPVPSFDPKNPYTFLQLVMDEKGNNYHILLQTNFSGKLEYLAYSNNLSALFNKKDKPMFLFLHCLKEMDKHALSVQITGAAIKCIIDRLNYCSSD